jgi:hypothetical protein
VTFQDNWANAKTDGADNEPPDTGTYEVALIDADAFVSKAGEDWVKFAFRRTSDDYEWDVIFGFRTPKATGFTKSQVAELGVDVDGLDSFDDLKAALAEKVGGFYEVEVVQNGDRRNTYVRGVNGGSDVPADTEGLDDARDAVAASKADDDIPF